MKLQVVVASHCANCGPALALADDLATRFPDLTVEIIDLDAAGAVVPDAAFAVPTYLLNDRILWLGNPDPIAAVAHLKHHLRATHDAA